MLSNRTSGVTVAAVLLILAIAGVFRQIIDVEWEHAPSHFKEETSATSRDTHTVTSQAGIGTGKWGENLSLIYPSPFTLAPGPWPSRDPSWENKLTVVTPRGVPYGQASSWDVHTQGLWHRDIFVVLHVGEQVLIQQRASWKWTYPRQWDVSAAESMEGNESFSTAAERAVSEELQGLIRIDGTAFRLETGAAAPALEWCCGPRTYIWEGAMEFMYLKEATIVEVWRGNIPKGALFRNGTAGDGDELNSDGNNTIGNGNDPEVAGFRLVHPDLLRAEAKTAENSSKYGPWFLDALAHCPACWIPSPG